MQLRLLEVLRFQPEQRAIAVDLHLSSGELGVFFSSGSPLRSRGAAGVSTGFQVPVVYVLDGLNPGILG